MKQLNKYKTKIDLEKIQNEYVIYVLTTQQNVAHLNMKPLGLEAKLIDATNLENKVFADLLNQLDGLAYGDKGLAMEKWVALDCGILPGAFIGLAKYANELNPELKEKFDLPQDYTGLIPLSEFCAIPTAQSGKWMMHTLATIIQNKGVGTHTEALGFAICPATKMLVVAQYNNSSALKVHTKFGNLNLLAAITPSHTQTEMTFIYETPLPSQTELKKILETNQPLTNPCPHFYLNAESLDEKNHIHEQIQTGLVNYQIVYPGLVENSLDSMHEPKIQIPLTAKATEKVLQASCK
ncbi:hypothetical protein HOK51_00470 [Candidatus Woesearchaeota archaeon]|jgi:hypothetical protein|nr:hypothetical protein [Candidatus Woesearchaeota archaeon]MBT6518287.1 hypothetical protein [Candidatus Woesearchaeota archaeon]MBT7367070.1 hypothetical protein [Candidatus Woesearchaeota archaeon]